MQLSTCRCTLEWVWGFVVWERICVHVHACVFAYALCAHVCECAYVCARVCACVFLCVCVRTCMRECVSMPKFCTLACWVNLSVKVQSCKSILWCLFSPSCIQWVMMVYKTIQSPIYDPSRNGEVCAVVACTHGCGAPPLAREQGWGMNSKAHATKMKIPAKSRRVSSCLGSIHLSSFCRLSVCMQETPSSMWPNGQNRGWVAG